MYKFEISRKKEKDTWLILPVVICLSQRLIHSTVAKFLDLEHGWQFFIISRIKKLSTAGQCTNLRFREKRKGNLVDPASNHMLVSKTNSFSRGQVFGFGARIAIFTISRGKNLSTAGPCTKLRFREERKEMVDPASSHMLVSKTK